MCAIANPAIEASENRDEGDAGAEETEPPENAEPSGRMTRRQLEPGAEESEAVRRRLRSKSAPENITRPAAERVGKRLRDEATEEEPVNARLRSEFPPSAGRRDG